MAYAPGVDLGTLKMIPEESRPSSWQLSGSTTRDSWTVAWTANSYAPYGAKAIRLKVSLSFTGDGTVDYASCKLRKYGSSVTDDDQCLSVVTYSPNAPTGVTPASYREIDVLCDENGVVEYYLYGASGSRADGILSMSTIGYWM